MFPELLRAEQWEMSSRNIRDDGKKVISECQTKACQNQLVTAFHICPVTFPPSHLCSSWSRGHKWLLSISSQWQMLIDLQTQSPGSNSAHTAASPRCCFLLLCSRKEPGFRLFLYFYHLLPLTFLLYPLLPYTHLLPLIPQLHIK